MGLKKKAPKVLLLGFWACKKKKQKNENDKSFENEKREKKKKKMGVEKKIFFNGEKKKIKK